MFVALTFPETMVQHNPTTAHSYLNMGNSNTDVYQTNGHRVSFGCLMASQPKGRETGNIDMTHFSALFCIEVALLPMFTSHFHSVALLEMDLSFQSYT